MKQLIVVLSGCIFFLLACNDNNQTVAESDTSDSAGKSADSPATAHHDTSASTAGSNLMMSAMMKHMDMMKKMKSMKDSDHDFAMMMKHHHTAAKEMAGAELLKGHHAEVKTMARKMMGDQEKDILQFDEFLNSPPAENKQGGDKFFNEAMQMMKDMPMDMGKTYTDNDEQFIAMMLPHHEQAVHMSKMYLQFANKTQMKKLANKIITTQQNEIKELQNLQSKSH